MQPKAFRKWFNRLQLTFPRMKTLLVALFLSVLAFSSSQAQQAFRFGPQAGLSLSTYRFASAKLAPAAYRSGVEAGLLARREWGHWGLQASALYVQKGVVVHNANVNLRNGQNLANGQGWEYESRLHYAAVPVSVFYAPSASGEGLQAYGGGYLACLLGGRYALTQTSGAYADAGPIQPSTGAVAVGDGAPVRRFDAGLHAGLGYRYGAVLLQAGYSLGLLSLRTNEGLAFYNGTVQCSLAYLLAPKGAAQ
jgi:hypothetical protein